jgi:DNA-binding NtrC family response regulator
VKVASGPLDIATRMMHGCGVPTPSSNQVLPPGSQAPLDSSAARLAVSRISVLVVDDENAIRRVVCAHLEQRGLVAVPAADGQDAMAALSVRKFDILITDLQMPRLDGLALLTAVQDQYPLMRRIVMTGYTTIENALGALKLGAIGFVPKPVDPVVLDESVDLAVAGLRAWMRQLSAIRKLHRGGT